MERHTQLAERINAALPVKSGALRVWGDWFGRPYDNMHVIVSASSEATAFELILVAVRFCGYGTPRK
jgi:hypothetical protein